MRVVRVCFPSDECCWWMLKLPRECQGWDKRARWVSDELRGAYYSCERLGAGILGLHYAREARMNYTSLLALLLHVALFCPLNFNGRRRRRLIQSWPRALPDVLWADTAKYADAPNFMYTARVAQPACSACERWELLDGHFICIFVSRGAPPPPVSINKLHHKSHFYPACTQFYTIFTLKIQII